MMSDDIQILRNKLISANLAEYGNRANAIHWATPERLAEAQSRRAQLLEALAPQITIANKQTKPHWGPLSPGCRICAQGKWSCLFINGKCNCRCFYCPTAQDDLSVPTTNRVPFETDRDYAQYVRRFGFSGASISGGEPMLTFDRTIDYIQSVRRELGDDLHIWLYTNGTLVTRERLEALKTAGLSEIRFDISAVDYNLAKPELAAGIIDCVTVEIPAIPEDAERLAALLPVMAAVGVRHLNLHQLRLTPHNFDRLIQRNYNFLHGEAVTVLESELTALSLLQTAIEQQLPLPINYCSFVYKRRFQQAATRRRNAGDMLKGWEAVTENGFIRSLVLTGPPGQIEPVAQHLEQHDNTRQRWTINAKQDRLQFHPSLWSFVDLSAGRLLVSYAEAILTPNISYRCAFKEVRLDSGKKIFIEKRPVRIDLPLTPEQRTYFEKQVIANSQTTPAAGTPTPGEMFAFESITPGLQDYY